MNVGARFLRFPQGLWSLTVLAWQAPLCSNKVVFEQPANVQKKIDSPPAPLTSFVLLSVEPTSSFAFAVFIIYYVKEWEKMLLVNV